MPPSSLEEREHYQSTNDLHWNSDWMLVWIYVTKIRDHVWTMFYRIDQISLPLRVVGTGRKVTQLPMPYGPQLLGHIQKAVWILAPNTTSPLAQVPRLMHCWLCRSVPCLTPVVPWLPWGSVKGETLEAGTTGVIRIPYWIPEDTADSVTMKESRLICVTCSSS